MTYQLYAARKEHVLQQVPAIARPSISTYFLWLANLNPGDVLDGIEQGKTIEQAYKNAPFALRMAVATARGILKYKPFQQKLLEIATPENSLMTLKYENPKTYEVIERYGDRGQTYMKTWIQGALRLLGVAI
jgi:hypothetical protein